MQEYRGYLINPAPQSPSLLKLAVQGQGGKLPDILTGLFTDYNTAKRDIDTYLDNLKVKRSGKTDPESGD